MGDPGSIRVGKISWREVTTQSSIFAWKILSTEDPGGLSPWGHKELDVTEQLTRGEGNGNPLQCSCLENSMDRGAWWGAVHGVTESWTQLSD